MSAQDRRIMTEVKYFKENYNDININIKNEVTELIVEDPKDKKYPKVKFVMKGKYPFCQPLVFVFMNGKETCYLKSRQYHSYPRIIKCIEIIKKMGSTIIRGEECLCCNSILCDTWSPVCTLEKIMDEIMQINYIKQQVKTLLGIDTLGKRYSISNDIELYIYKFLY